MLVGKGVCVRVGGNVNVADEAREGDRVIAGTSLCTGKVVEPVLVQEANKIVIRSMNKIYGFGRMEPRQGS